MPPRALIVQNLSSGRQQADPASLLNWLESNGWGHAHRSFKAGDSVAPLLEDVEGFDAAIAIGGDGTISTLANRLRMTQVPLLVWPAGTGNLVAQNLFRNLAPETLLEVFAAGRACAFDMGEIAAGGLRRRFLMLAGAGTDAHMILESEALKPEWGMAAYVLALMKQMQAEPARIRLRVDGRVVDEPEAVGVLVANLGRISFRFPLLSGISPMDGALDVLVIRRMSTGLLLTEFWVSLLEQWTGIPLERDDVGLYRGREIELASEPSLPLQFDGEALDVRTPVRFSVLPGALRLFCQQEDVIP